MAKTKKMSTGTEMVYRNFLDNVELYALGLEKLTANLERAAYFDATSEKGEEVIRAITTKFVVSDFDGDHFDIDGSFDLSFKLEDGAPLLSIEASYSAHFHPREGSFIKKHAEKFASAEARLIFWPYFRQTIADTTSRMHIRPVTIPLVLKS